MKYIIWEDGEGFLHRSLVKNEDSEEQAQLGIPLDPPDIYELDWDAIKQELHNLLVKNELFSFDDIQRRKDNPLSKAANVVLAKKLTNLYRANRSQR